MRIAECARNDRVLIWRNQWLRRNKNKNKKTNSLIPENFEDCQAALSKARREAAEVKDKHRAAAQVENVRRWTERETLARAKESQRSPLRQAPGGYG